MVQGWEKHCLHMNGAGAMKVVYFPHRQLSETLRRTIMGKYEQLPCHAAVAIYYA